jgi:uncharacterized protein YkwD
MPLPHAVAFPASSRLCATAMPMNRCGPADTASSIASGSRPLRCLAWLGMLTMGMGMSQAQASPALVDLINVHRSEDRRCEGAQLDAAGPLAAHAGLSKVQIDAGTDVQAAMKAQGYQPARVFTISLSGATSAGAAMALIEQRYCQPLMNPAFADIGVSREGNRWQIVLARPVISPDLPDWQDAGRDILKLTNQARGESRRCGQATFASAQPLAWAPALAGAALVHSRDMAKQNYFRHRAKDGDRASDRVDRKGYVWRRVGENIAAGQGSAQQAVSAWLSSPPHCANLMNPNYTEMGAAYAVDADSDSTIYWTQVFATPR